jgi:hypothetical protein
MHAVVSTVDIDPSRLQEATELLPTQVIPSLEALPGFVRATFLRDVLAPRGMSVVVFDTEANAKAAADGAGGPADSPVTFTSTLVYEVVADTA